MNIEQVIYLWDKSNCKRLCIKNLPVVNHKGEIVCSTGFYYKDEIILYGGEISVYSYLKKIYHNSLFIFKDVNDYIFIEKII